jgi:hypothetical protein
MPRKPTKPIAVMCTLCEKTLQSTSFPNLTKVLRRHRETAHQTHKGKIKFEVVRANA